MERTYSFLSRKHQHSAVRGEQIKWSNVADKLGAGVWFYRLVFWIKVYSSQPKLCFRSRSTSRTRFQHPARLPAGMYISSGSQVLQFIFFNWNRRISDDRVQGLRSGSAAEKLHSLGFGNIAYITGGLDNSMPGDLPKVGSVDLKKAGEVIIPDKEWALSFIILNSATSAWYWWQGGVSRYRAQLLIGLSTILWTGVAFLQFFPEQAKVYLSILYKANE